MWQGVGLGREAVNQLGTSLQSSVSLLSLELGGNPELGDAGLRALAHGLKRSCLRTLGLDSSGLRDSSGPTLAVVLRDCASLRTLRLQHNKLADDAAAAIAGALEAKAGAAGGLRELLLQHNSIGDRGARALQAAAEVSTSLAAVDLRFNLVTSSSLLAAITAACRAPPRLRTSRPGAIATAESSDSDESPMRVAAANQLRSSRPAAVAGAAFAATASCQPAASRPSRACVASCSNSSDSGDSPARTANRHPQRGTSCGTARSVSRGSCGVNLDSSDSDDLDAAATRAASSRARSTAARVCAARVRAAACHPQCGTTRCDQGGACGVNFDSSDSDESPVCAAARRPQRGTACSGGGGSCGVKLVRDALDNLAAGLSPAERVREIARRSLPAGPAARRQRQ